MYYSYLHPGAGNLGGNPVECPNRYAAMVEQVINKHKVRLFDSIDELPIVRFHKYQKMLMIDAGIGADLASFDRHIEKMRRYMAKGQTDNATTEMQNLRQCVYLMQAEVSPKHRAFAVLVESIDGKRCDDLSDAGLEGVLAQLGAVTVGEVEKASAEVKKNLTRN